MTEREADRAELARQDRRDPLFMLTAWVLLAAALLNGLVYVILVAVPAGRL